jgi:peptide/nickel transport system substrate-binding protein
MKACAALLVLGAALAFQSSPAAAEKVLHAVMGTDLKALDSYFESSDITRTFSFMVFDQLFAMDANFEPQPMMAEGFALSDDRLTYTIKLRSGLKFHDGAPVTTADVIASIKRWMEADTAGGAVKKRLASLDAVDDLTFTIKLKEPYGILIESLAKYGAKPLFIMPARLAETPADQPMKEIIGSGPFKFVANEWVPGSKVVFVKNPDYVPRSEPPSGFAGAKDVKLDRVEWLSIPDAQSQVNALMQGEVDLVEMPAPDLLPILKQSEDIDVEVLDKIGYVGLLRLNWLYPPFNDVRARKAMQWIVHQPDILQAITGGDPSLGVVCGAVMLCNTVFQSETGAEPLLSTEPAEARYAKAQALLKEAGYNGEKIILLDSSDQFAVHNAATIVAAEMREAGMNVEVVPMDSGSIQTREGNNAPPAKGGWNVTLRSGGIGNQFPTFSRNASAACDKAWYGWPCDQKIEDIIKAWGVAPTLDDRKKLAEELQARTMEVVSWIPYGQWLTPTAHRKNVTGVLPLRKTIAFWNMDIQEAD